MPGRRSSFQRNRGSSRRRKVTWSEGPGDTVSASANSSVLFGDSSQAIIDDLTLTRIRGNLLAQLTSVTTALDGFGRIAVGICNVSENAAGTGVGAIPTPITDIGWDGWIWHTQFSLISLSAVEADVRGGGTYREVIDNKAMRKVHATDVLVAVAEMADEVGAASVQLRLQTRILDMLP